MICKKCGKDFEGKFCSECGSPTDEHTHMCELCSNVFTGAYCNQCGKPLNDERHKNPPRKWLLPTFCAAALIVGVAIGLILGIAFSKSNDDFNPQPGIREDFDGENGALPTPPQVDIGEPADEMQPGDFPGDNGTVLPPDRS